eukprot:scaffold226633_cov18-Tisochrysis_lutea.AAC.1
MSQSLERIAAHCRWQIFSSLSGMAQSNQRATLSRILSRSPTYICMPDPCVMWTCILTVHGLLECPGLGGGGDTLVGGCTSWGMKL